MSEQSSTGQRRILDISQEVALKAAGSWDRGIAALPQALACYRYCPSPADEHRRTGRAQESKQDLW